MDGQKDCNNCKYFEHYYIKRNNGFKMLNYRGFCLNDEVKKAEFKKRLCGKAECEFWEPMQPKIEERREETVKILLRICRQLENIALLLKDEN